MPIHATLERQLLPRRRHLPAAEAIKHRRARSRAETAHLRARHACNDADH
jgi:hypothetical protein